MVRSRADRGGTLCKRGHCPTGRCRRPEASGRSWRASPDGASAASLSLEIGWSNKPLCCRVHDIDAEPEGIEFIKQRDTVVRRREHERQELGISLNLVKI